MHEILTLSIDSARVVEPASSVFPLKPFVAPAKPEAR
jgi:hypothetical protein